jgi:hypothetical protein
LTELVSSGLLVELGKTAGLPRDLARVVQTLGLAHPEKLVLHAGDLLVGEPFDRAASLAVRRGTFRAPAIAAAAGPPEILALSYLTINHLIDPSREAPCFVLAYLLGILGNFQSFEARALPMSDVTLGMAIIIPNLCSFINSPRGATAPTTIAAELGSFLWACSDVLDSLLASHNSSLEERRAHARDSFILMRGNRAERESVVQRRIMNVGDRY